MTVGRRAVAGFVLVLQDADAVVLEHDVGLRKDPRRSNA
jgi:hypothetical protein